MSYYLMTNPGYMLGTILVGIAMVFSLYCQAVKPQTLPT